MGGGQPRGSQPAGGWVTQQGGRGSAKIGQQNEYSLHGGRYASCVHAGGISCCVWNGTENETLLSVYNYI